MTIKESPEAAEAVLDRVLAEEQYPESFSLLGREWELMRGVFPGTLTGTTEVMASTIPFPREGSFLEVGSGTGVIAVTAALSGCRHVTALDISEKAVANTRANAHRHGVEGAVRTLQSDLFSALQATERFDMIFWNVPWTYVESGFVMRSDLHGAIFDPGYKGQDAYLGGAHKHLVDSGRLLIGTADLGDRERLDASANAVGLTITTLRKVRRVEVQRVMEYQLLEAGRGDAE